MINSIPCTKGYKYYDPCEPYTRILTAVIARTIMNALGYDLADQRYKKCKHQEKQSAIAYVLSDDFEEDMEAIGYLHKVREIRERATSGTCQLPLKRQV